MDNESSDQKLSTENTNQREKANLGSGLSHERRLTHIFLSYVYEDCMWYVYDSVANIMLKIDYVLGKRTELK